MGEQLPTHRLAVDAAEQAWGWTIDPPQVGRVMHLHCFTADLPDVVLEAPGGRRGWQVSGLDPGLEQALRSDAEAVRESIAERQYSADLIRAGRLVMEVEGVVVRLRVYPGEGEISFERVIDLRKDAGVLHPPTGDGEIALTTEPEAAIVIYADRPSRWQVTVPLAGVLWRWP